MQFGRVKKAPENYVSKDLFADVAENGMDETRRGFCVKVF